MASVNKAIILGNLGADPDCRQAGESLAATLSIATSRKYKDRSGQLVEETEWHRVVLFGRSAEIARDYLRKGRPVYIEGRIRTRKWQDKNGQDRYTTEVVGDVLQLIGGREDRQDDQAQEQYARQTPPTRQQAQAQAQPQTAQYQRYRQQDAPPPDYSDDVPF